MPIKLLHHKSYHVYNKANIERVRRDEKLAEEEDRKKKEQSLSREREERTRLLRAKAGTEPKENVKDVKVCVA
jgi:hypothetical protein